MSKRKIVAHYWAKPIPIRSCDWVAYEDGEEEQGRYGYGATEAEARADLEASFSEDEP